MLYDRAEKQRRGYVEKDSIVRQDGSERLVGRDWSKRKLELRERCKGRCEFRWRDMWERRCPEAAQDPHHIIPRSKGRDDRLRNLQALCRMHHMMLDGRKVKWSKNANSKTSQELSK